MFNLPDNGSAIWLTVPATFATAYGFTFAAGRVTICMARSGLLPEIFTTTYGSYKTPIVAHAVGALMGYGLCLLSYFVPVVTGGK